MKPGDEGVVLGKVRVVVREVYPDGTALVEVVPARIPDVDASVKNIAPGMRLKCSQEAILLDGLVTSRS